jgi:glyoxylase-like metal-dependent hydrolase (beta-lactamase superfamily II)
MKRIGPIMILEAPNQCKLPYSRSLYIDCPERILIDSGCDPDTLVKINQEYGIELIMNTHYHPDHTQFNHLLPTATKWINPIEFETSITIEGVARSNGVFQEWGAEGIEKWKKSIPKGLVQSLSEISGAYQHEIEYSFGGVKVVFLHTPGHTGGFTCPYFPDLGVVFVGDYDMSSFGPWYNGTDGDIDDFIQSGKRLLSLDADTYITGHHKGIFSKHEFRQAMEQFLAVIDKRDELIEHYARQELTFEEITDIGIFYPKKMLKSMIHKTWERSGIRKHLQRLGITLPESNIVLNIE